jgi:FMN reductase
MRLTMGPLIVGIGGTTRSGSSSESALRLALASAKDQGARIEIVCGADLILPPFDPSDSARSAGAIRLVQLLRECDGVILSSPGYHGSLSGLLKNALDYTEDMRLDERPYLEGRAVGSIVCAQGWQATGTTLAALRSVVHALRGWPTPLGVCINSGLQVFDGRGVCADSGVDQQLHILGQQVVTFANRWGRAL